MPEQPSQFVIGIGVIEEIVKAITGSFDLDEVGQSVVDSIVKYLDSPGGTLLLVDEKKKALFAHSTSNTPLIRRIVKMLKKSFRKHTFSYVKEPMTLLSRTVKERKIFESLHFEDFLSPEVPSFLARIIQRLARVKMSISIPVIINHKIIGVLFISFYEETITAERMAMLAIFSDFAAIAINNATKYEELQDRYKEVNRRFKIEKETIAMLSHELKTPIAIASNTAHTMEYAFEEKNAARKSSWEEMKILNANLIDALERLNQITDSVMILREVESQGISLIHELNLQNQLTPLLETFKKNAKKRGIALRYHFDLAKGKFYGGGVQFEQLVAILIDNAIKYTEKGEIEIEIKATDRALSCSVTDTGIGIPLSKRKIIFQRFYRYHDARKQQLRHISGLGLGLYIAKKIVEHLDGSIKVTKNPHRNGSRFMLEIPIYQRPPAP